MKKKVLGGDLPAKGLHTANTRHSRSLEAGTAVRLLGCGRKSEGGCMSSMPSSVKVTSLSRLCGAPDCHVSLSQDSLTQASLLPRVDVSESRGA